jgi:hypothetical protein
VEGKRIDGDAIDMFLGIRERVVDEYARTERDDADDGGEAEVACVDGVLFSCLEGGWFRFGLRL